jgi:hypothetical protein
MINARRSTNPSRRLRKIAIAIAAAAVAPFAVTKAVHVFLERPLVDPGDSWMVSALFAVGVCLVATCAIAGAARDLDVRDSESTEA